MALLHYLTYLAYRVLESFLAFVPLSVCWLSGDLLGRLAYLLLMDRRRLVGRNVRLALGQELGKRECRRIVRRHFASLGRHALCGPKLARMKPVAVERRIRYENRQTVLDLVAEGNGLVAAWAGMGPGELFEQAAVFGPGVPGGVLHRKLRNPFSERYLARSRLRDEVRLFPLGQELSSAIGFLREGSGLGVRMDWEDDQEGIWCPLFGRITPTSNLPGLLSVRTGAPAVPVAVYPDGIARWRICYGEAVRGSTMPGASEGDCSAATAKLTAILEGLLRRAPEEWDWQQERWETPAGELLFSRQDRPVGYAAGMEAAPLKPFRILVRSPNWLGDACMAVPAVRALKAGRPDAEISVLCNDNLKELWQQVPEVSKVIAKTQRAMLVGVAVRIAREGPWNAGVLFPNSPRSALEMKLGGVPLIAGYGGRGRSLLLNRRVNESRQGGPPEHHARRYIRIAEALGADGSDPALFAPREHQPPVAGRWRIGLCPGAAYGDAKRWPVERYARTVEKLHQKLDGKVDWVVYGAPKEAPIAAKLQADSSVTLDNRVGRTTLTELIEDLKKAHLLITNDTGTMHLAAMLGVRTVAIFGSTEPSLTAPLGEGHEVLRVHVDCSPCFLRQCPRDFRCMTAIREEDVADAALKIVRSLEGTLAGR